MARSGGIDTPLDPGFVARVAAGVRYAISGVAPDGWFTPGQPLQPVAQEQAEGRVFDYPVGVNFTTAARTPSDGLSFAQLRAFADAYDLLRLAIETRKDQVEAFQWQIVPEDEAVAPDSMAGAIEAATTLMRRPDGTHRFGQWLRMLVEELLVIDAVAIYPRANRGGGVYGFELIDGATIKRLIDDGGRTPLPPSPAYQQVLKGLPAVDYSTQQLVYHMRNPRVSRLYGHSPVEQVITTVNLALRRQATQLSHYTEGSVPDGIAQVPETWTPKQIADFQVWWDSVTNGPGPRSRIRFIPSLDGITFPRLNVIKDEMDEWLARIICYAFSITPSALLKQVNRASGEQMADTAKEEGLYPLLRCMEGWLTDLLQQHGKFGGVAFRFKTDHGADPLVQSQIHTAYINAKVITPDEARADLGREAMTPAQREAAFPAPPAPLAPGQDEDEPPKKGAGKQEDETPAEKMLAQALAMLEPERLAKLIAEAAATQAPRIVEVRPEVNVDVGDTVVHVPAARAAAEQE